MKNDVSPDNPADQIERWNRRYDREDYLFGTEPSAFLVRQAHRLKPGWRALAIADGEGRNGVWLAEQGLSVLSIDVSPVAQAKAQRLAQARGVSIETQLVDLESWQWPDERFDVIAAIFIQFAGPALRRRIFEGMTRTLKPGGLLLLQGYRPEQIAYGTGGPSAVENLYTEELLKSSFSSFELLQLSTYDAAVAEGDGHNGMSALIDLVALKPST